MKKAVSCLAAVLVLGGCMRVSPAHDVYGNPAYYVECNMGPKNVCYQKLKKLCPKGYYVVDKNMDGALPLGIGSNKDITIRCK